MAVSMDEALELVEEAVEAASDGKLTRPEVEALIRGVTMAALDGQSIPAALGRLVLIVRDMAEGSRVDRLRRRAERLEERSERLLIRSIELHDKADELDAA